MNAQGEPEYLLLAQEPKVTPDNALRWAPMRYGSLTHRDNRQEVVNELVPFMDTRHTRTCQTAFQVVQNIAYLEPLNATANSPLTQKILSAVCEASAEQPTAENSGRRVLLANAVLALAAMGQPELNSVIREPAMQNNSRFLKRHLENMQKKWKEEGVSITHPAYLNIDNALQAASCERYICVKPPGTIVPLMFRLRRLLCDRWFKCWVYPKNGTRHRVHHRSTTSGR